MLGSHLRLQFLQEGVTIDPLRGLHVTQMNLSEKESRDLTGWTTTIGQNAAEAEDDHGVLDSLDGGPELLPAHASNGLNVLERTTGVGKTLTIVGVFGERTVTRDIYEIGRSGQLGTRSQKTIVMTEEIMNGAATVHLRDRGGMTLRIIETR